MRLCAACLFTLGCGPTLAQGTPSEAAVKAAYLYKFLAYVQWPPAALASAESALVVGVAGDDAVYAELQGLIIGRRVEGRPVEVRRLSESDLGGGLHVLFVGQSPRESQALQDWIRKLHGRPVLVVTDMPGGLEFGAMLNLILLDGRVRFSASPAVAERTGLRLSARLLAVADRVVLP